jgi:hypothetical protein
MADLPFDLAIPDPPRLDVSEWTTEELLPGSVQAKMSRRQLEACVEHFKHFADTLDEESTRCPRCGGDLAMFFTWGLVHGQGYCTNSVDGGRCGWPVTLYHYFRAETEDESDHRLVVLAPAHPDEVTTNRRG